MTTATGDPPPDDTDQSGDVYLTDAGAEHWQSMLDTLDIAPDRWMDRPILSCLHIQYRPDGSCTADVQLYLAGPVQVIPVCHHRFPAGHINRVDFDDPASGPAGHYS